MNLSVWIAFGTLAVTVLGSIIGFVMWLTQMDMRLRVAEKAADEFWKIRDTVLSIDGHLKSMREDIKELADSLREPPHFGPPNLQRTRRSD